MTYKIESGAGTPGATAFASPTFVTNYLTDRARETQGLWSTQTTARQKEACVVATSYIETRWGSRFKGTRLRKAIDGRKASGTIEFGSTPLDTETVVIGDVTYRFVDTLAQENDILRSSAALNLVAALSQGGTASGVHEDTVIHYEVSGSADGDVVTIEAQAMGENGNEIPFTTTVTGATISGSGTLTGGLDIGPQPLSFPRAGLYDKDGKLVQNVPLKVKQAMAEYAVRSLSTAIDAAGAITGALDPDPVTDETGVGVVRSASGFGPMREDITYAEGAPLTLSKPYPAADRLLSEYITTSGVIR